MFPSPHPSAGKFLMCVKHPFSAPHLSFSSGDRVGFYSSHGGRERGSDTIKGKLCHLAVMRGGQGCGYQTPIDGQRPPDPGRHTVKAGSRALTPLCGQLAGLSLPYVGSYPWITGRD